MIAEKNLSKQDPIKHVVSFKFKEDAKIEEIENYAIDTQENEERYIHEINCLMQARYLLGGDGNCLVI